MTQGAYRHDLRCPHCGSNRMPKYDTSRGQQTRRCGDYHYRYTPWGNRHYYSGQVKSQALSMYLEASSRSATDRVLGGKTAPIGTRGMTGCPGPATKHIKDGKPTGTGVTLDLAREAELVGTAD